MKNQGSSPLQTLQNGSADTWVQLARMVAWAAGGQLSSPSAAQCRCVLVCLIHRWVAGEIRLHSPLTERGEWGAASRAVRGLTLHKPHINHIQSSLLCNCSSAQELISHLAEPYGAGVEVWDSSCTAMRWVVMDSALCARKKKALSTLWEGLQANKSGDSVS